MTMMLTIKNTDSNRVARYVIEERDVNTGSLTTCGSQAIYAGQSADVYVHAGRRVIVTEDANASMPAEDR